MIVIFFPIMRPRIYAQKAIASQIVVPTDQGKFPTIPEVA
jgi:hypothetical protein